MPFALSRTSRLVRGASLAAATLAASTTFAVSAHAADVPAWNIYFSDATPTAAYPNADYVSFGSNLDSFKGKNTLVGTLTRGGVEIARTDPSLYGPYGSASLADLRAGDVLHVTDSETGAEQLQVAFDGKPSFGPEVCVGATSATGVRAEGSIVTYGGAYSPVGSSNYGTPNEGVITGGEGAGTSFSMALKAPLALSDEIYVASVADLPGGINVSSGVTRTVGACPVPVAAPTVAAPVAVDKTAPKGASTPGKGFKKLSLSDVAKKGFKFTVHADEAATLKGTLTLQTKSGKGKKKKEKFTPIGSVTQNLAAGQTAEIKLKAGPGTKGKLKKAAKGSKLVIVLTLTDAAGNVTTLPGTVVSVPQK